MSLDMLKTMNGNVLNIVIYSPSPFMDYYVRQKLKDIFNVDSDFVVDVATAKQLTNAKLDSLVAPLTCDKWLIHVDTEKVSLKECLSAFKKNTASGVTVYWVKTYRTFMQLTESDEAKELGVYLRTHRLSKIQSHEIWGLHKEIVPSHKQLDVKLMNFVIDNYSWEPQSVMQLFNHLKSGGVIENKKEIIELIGIGGNSPTKVLVKALTTGLKTEKAKKSQAMNIIKMIKDLAITYNYSTIRNFMLKDIDTFLSMKQLQVMGHYNKVKQVIPEGFDEKSINRVKRFKRTILEDVTVARLLNLRVCLTNYKGYDAEIGLLQGFMMFYDTIPVEEGS